MKVSEVWKQEAEGIRVQSLRFRTPGIKFGVQRLRIETPRALLMVCGLGRGVYDVPCISPLDILLRVRVCGLELGWGFEVEGFNFWGLGLKEPEQLMHGV